MENVDQWGKEMENYTRVKKSNEQVKKEYH
jgi:hypothetical protein